MRARVLLFAVAASVAGCDTLFPELAGKPADMASSSDGGDLGAAHELQGQVCVLADVRDYRSCAPVTLSAALRITVEETRDQTATDLAGNFTLPLTALVASATVAVVDSTGRYQTTIVPLRLTNGAALHLALPLVPAATMTAVAANALTTLQPNAGAVLGWAVDEVGLPVTGVAANQPILVDGDATNQLYAGSATGSRGAVALLNLAPPSLALTLTTPSGATVAGDSFTLPVRAGAVTASTLVLPPR